MIPWIQVYSNLPRHPKLSALAEGLDIKSAATDINAVALGLLVSLWSWAIQNAFDGDLSRCTDRAIAEAAGWRKKPETFVEALMQNGWLDEDRKLHNWDEYATLYINREAEKREKNREKVAKFRASKEKM